MSEHMGTGLWVHVNQHTVDTSQLHSTHSDAHHTPENTIALGDDEQKVQCTIAQGLPLKVIVDLADLLTHTQTRSHMLLSNLHKLHHEYIIQLHHKIQPKSDIIYVPH